MRHAQPGNCPRATRKRNWPCLFRSPSMHCIPLVIILVVLAQENHCISYHSLAHHPQHMNDVVTIRKMHQSAEPSCHHMHIIRMCAIRGKIADVWLSTEGVLDLCNGVVSEKSLQIFWPLLPAVYVTVFSGGTDAPEVRCDLTDIQTHTDRQTDRPTKYCTPRCASAPRVNK